MSSVVGADNGAENEVASWSCADDETCAGKEGSTPGDSGACVKYVVLSGSSSLSPSEQLPDAVRIWELEGGSGDGLSARNCGDGRVDRGCAGRLVLWEDRRDDMVQMDACESV